LQNQIDGVPNERGKKNEISANMDPKKLGVSPVVGLSGKKGWQGWEKNKGRVAWSRKRTLRSVKKPSGFGGNFQDKTPRKDKCEP